ncbi:hypothetical protein BDN72DRAFT_419797 [Pluteus cervinus]|uniref:Uncharacterized protein n=1 Tax=Pluteus cervinus TaxID=181527 RepID=A0ACD3A905_9AGAR|nr:hypothetical protein BDN72DRAFT_419797 [Pluteus cervinus]
MDMEGYDSEMSLIPTFKSRLRPGRRTPCLSSDEHGLMVARDVSSPPPSLSYSAAADHHIPLPLSSPIRHATVESSSPPPMTPFSLTKRGGFLDREERGWDPKLASNSQSTMDLRYYQRRDGVDVRSSSPSLPLRMESGGGRSLHIVKDRQLGPSSSETSNFSFSSSPPSFASYDKYEAYHLPRSYTERDGGGFSRGERVGQVYKHPYYQYHRQPDRPQRPITTFNIHPHRRHQSLHIPSSSQTLRHSRISGQQHITPTPDDDADADTADADANMDVFGESTTSSTYSFDFPASSSRLTFFRTSSERGHWKDDPMALHRRTPQLQSSPARPMKMTPSNSMSDSMLVPSMLDGRSKALSSPPSVPPSYTHTHTHTHSHSRKALSISSLCDSQPDLLLIPPSSSPTSSLVPGFTLSSSSPTSLSVSPPNSALSSSSSSGFPLRMDLRDPERDTPYSDVPHTLPSLSSDRASSLGVDVDLLDEEKDGGGGRDVAGGGATGRRDALNHDDAEDDDEDDDDVLGLPSSPVRVHDVLRFKSPMQIGGTSSPTLLGVYGEERKAGRHGRPLQHRQEQQRHGRQQQQRQKRSLKFREVSPLPPSSPMLSPTDEERRDGCMSPVMRPVSPLSLDEDEDEVEMGDEHERLAGPADVDLDLDLALPASSPLSSAPSSPLAVAVDLPILTSQPVVGLKETPSTRVRISSLLNHDDGGEVVMRQVSL